MDDRKAKYRNNNTFVEERPKLEISCQFWDLVCSYVLSENQNIRKQDLYNLQQFISALDQTASFPDEQRQDRLKFILRALEAKLDLNLENRDAIISHINGGILDAPIIPMENIHELSNGDIEYIRNEINSGLRCILTQMSCSDVLQTLLKMNDAQSLGERSKYLESVESNVSKLARQFNITKGGKKDESAIIIGGDDFDDRLKYTYDLITSPFFKLQSGIQILNDYLAGGFESGRVYTIFGIPGEGKSMTLLDLCLQIKKYNTGYVAKDKTKTPCIIFLTMENDLKETLQRILSLVGFTGNIANCSFEEYRELFFRYGLNSSPDSPIEIIIEYVPQDGTVTTDILYELYDKYDSLGKECVCLIQDYMKRIRSSTYHGPVDLRLELGAISNEFKTFAQDKQIPIITASQLNRDAARHIDESKNKNEHDYVKYLGRSNISDSIMILENIDCGISIYSEMYKTEDAEVKYLGFKKIKTRYKPNTDVDFFFIPFTQTGALVQDVGTIPQHMLTLNPNASKAENFMNNHNVKKYHVINTPVVVGNGAGNIKEAEDINEFIMEYNPMPLPVPQKQPLIELYHIVKKQ